MPAALDLLLSPVAEEEFFRDYWERRHLYVTRDDPQRFAMLFSAADLPQVIAAAAEAMRRQSPFEVPFMEIVAHEEGRNLIAVPPTVAGVDEAFASGATVRLNQLRQYWPPIEAFIRQLERELGFLTGVSAYCAPAGAHSVGEHFDGADTAGGQSGGPERPRGRRGVGERVAGHDAAVVQMGGSRRWGVGPGAALPLEFVPLLPFESREE